MSVDPIGVDATPRGDVDDLISYLDASPSPWHVVASSTARLVAAGFVQVDEASEWRAVQAGFVVRGASIVAWRRPDVSGPTAGFRIVGAHTDSPCLRIKPRPDSGLLGWKQLGVEVYGGALLNSWLDRDLGIAGRVILRNGDSREIAVHEPIARVPQLAIHLDRDVNEKGLVLDKQQHLTPFWGVGPSRNGEFAEWLAGRLHVPATEVSWWELSLFDVTGAARLGADQSLLASGRMDNQLSCWAATRALAAGSGSVGASDGGTHTSVIALFDHEEVGSESPSGAAGPLLSTVLERLSAGSRDEFHRALAASVCVSADNAHAVHPNYPDRHEPAHRPMVNQGPAIKINANQRYATSADSALQFQLACERVGVPWQVFVSKNNMPCGSTIGPITATRLGIPTVDVGIPQLSMHSARELCGVEDPGYMAKALAAFFDGAE